MIHGNALYNEPFGVYPNLFYYKLVENLGRSKGKNNTNPKTNFKK
jgi:hypothetical protein